MRTKTSIKALVELMDDTDPMVIDHAQSVLLSYGEEIIPDLEQIEDAAFSNPVLLENVSRVLHQIRFIKIKNSLCNWLSSRDKDLMEAIYCINSYQFPELKTEEFTSQFQSLRHEFWLKINPRQTSFEKIEILNEVFFNHFGFCQLSKSYYSPFEIFTNSVLDTREGSGLALGLIYSIVAQSLNLPIYGVTSMNNRTPFMLAYLDKSNLLPILRWGINNNGVLFYVDLENKGEIITPKQLKESYLLNGLPEDRTQFEPSPNSVIVKKYLNDIKRSYSSQPHYRYKLDEINELLDLFN